MEINKVDEEFEKAIYRKSLVFTATLTEKLYLNTLNKKISNDILLNSTVFGCAALLAFYNCYVALRSNNLDTVSTVSFIYKIIIVLSTFLVSGIEITFICIDKLKSYKGVLFYIGCHIIFIDSATTNFQYPAISIRSFFGAIILQYFLFSYVKKWIIALFSNLIITIYSMISLFVRFHSILSLETSIDLSITLILLPNICTIFYYGAEKQNRKNFYLSLKLRMKSEKWKNVLNYLPVGMMLVNQEKNIKFCNREMSSVLSHPEGTESAINESNSEIKRSDISKTLERFVDINRTSLKEAIFSHTTLNEKVYRMNEESSQKEYEVRLKAFELSNEQRILIAVVKDQTVYKDLIKTTAIEKNQKMLLASISHELRNPLNAIFGYLTLTAKSSGEESASIYQKIFNSAKKIEFIVYGACLLLLAESRDITVDQELFDIRKVFEDILCLHRDSFESKEIQLIVNCNFFHEINSDYKKLCLILFHLISNALKYTEKGRILISAKACLTDSSLVEISISDTGTGITPDKLPRLFELYSSLEKVNPYNPQGMGLGLALCKRLTLALGGTIRVESQLGVGSTFTFSIKRREDVKNTHNNILKSQNSFKLPSILTKECGSPKVLIVDDESTNRFVFKTYLRDLNCVADEADNGETAIKKAIDRARLPCCKGYNLILMDINMPIMDGTIATEKLRKMMKNKELSFTPIIAVTAANLNTREDFEKLTSIGFDDVLLKPVTKSNFIRRVQKFLVDPDSSKEMIQ